MNATRTFVATEVKLQFRDLMAVGFGLAFPTVLLVVLGFAFPGFREPVEDLGGARLVDLYTPILLMFCLVTVGVGTLATQLASYRHDGILRRLRTTPVGPSRLLAAQLVAQGTVAALGILLAGVVAWSVLGVTPPVSLVGVVVALLLTAAAMFSIGLLIGAASTSAATAQAATFVLWLPLMLLAGLSFPREAMPPLMRRISDLSPGGAGVDAVQQAWFVGGWSLSSLAVLAGSAVVLGGLAAVAFRWE